MGVYGIKKADMNWFSHRAFFMQGTKYSSDQKCLISVEKAATKVRVLGKGGGW